MADKAAGMRLVVAGIEASVRLKKMRYLRIRVARTGEVMVSAPLNAPLKNIEDFVRLKAPWIRGCVERFRAKNEPSDMAEFLGKKYKIITSESAKIEFIDGGEGVGSVKVPSLAAWEGYYKEQLRLIIGGFLDKYKGDFGPINRVSFKTMHTRWGSCNAKKRYLNFSYFLAKTPLDFIEYVVVHELCHLKIANHSAGFWALVASIMPDYKDKKRLC